MTDIENDVIKGLDICLERYEKLWNYPLDELTAAASRIRGHFCGDSFDFCSIINGKSGRCPEDCRYCAQSSAYGAHIDEYPLLGRDVLLRAAERSFGAGIKRFSIVTSGRKLSPREAEELCTAAAYIKKRCGVSLCVSCGLLDDGWFSALKDSGVERYHCNLETSRRFFPEICSTHSYDDKLEVLKKARAVGMEICCGGIIGMGETREDRTSLALELKKLRVSSVPLNILTPIKGTPLENARPLPYDEILRTAAVFRFILPSSFIRAAGGRAGLPDKGRGLFLAGVNAAITGDMLTTGGVSAAQDKALIKELGFSV